MNVRLKVRGLLSSLSPFGLDTWMKGGLSQTFQARGFLIPGDLLSSCNSEDHYSPLEICPDFVIGPFWPKLVLPH